MATITALPANAQTGLGGVQGVVASTDGENLSAAVVELRARGDTAAVRSVLTRTDGRFQIDNVGPGDYMIRIGILGFGDAETDEFTVAADQTRNLGTIRLEVSALSIDPVIVSVSRADVTFEADRTGYLVEAIAGAGGGAITDALRGIPDLDIDIDGNVELRGETPAIYIDGRPAPMDGISLSIFLEQFPADQIERIEVIDVPPARYRAEGSAGIVNIVLKEGAELGLNGNLALAAGTRGEWTGSGRATLQRGPWTLNGGLNSRLSDSESSDLIVRQNLLADPITYLQQQSESDRSNRSVGGRLEIRRELSENARMWTRVSADGNGSDRSGITETSLLSASQLPTLEYDRVASSDDGRGSGGITSGFSYDWERDRHTLEVELSAEWNRSRNSSRDEIVADAFYLDDDLLPVPLTLRDDGSDSNRLEFQLDYERPLSEVTGIEVGMSSDYESASEDQTTSLFRTVGIPSPDNVDARLISRDQTINSAYLTLERRFGSLGLQGGVRAEKVDEMLGLPTGQTFDRNSTDIFPSFNLNWRVGSGKQARIGYSQRIRRPGLNVLDPTDRSTDPLNRTVGNPSLGSSVTQNVSGFLSWNGDLGNLTLGSYWNQTSDGWERITTVDEDGISTRSWDNLTARTRTGSSLNFRFPSFHGWRGRANLSGGWSTLEGSLRGNSVVSDQFVWSTGGNVDGPVIGELTTQISFGYNPPNDLVQGRTSGEWEADFGFRYRLLDNRGSLRLSLRDPFLLRESSETIRDASVIQTGNSRVTSRRASLTFSYAFSQGASVQGARRGAGGGRRR